MVVVERGLARWPGALSECPGPAEVLVCRPGAYSDAPGAVVNGEAMGNLPPSMQAIYTENRAGNATALRQAVLGSWDRRLDVTVRGSREISFSIDPNR